MFASKVEVCAVSHLWMTGEEWCSNVVGSLVSEGTRRQDHHYRYPFTRLHLHLSNNISPSLWMTNIRALLSTIILALLAIIYRYWLQRAPATNEMPDLGWHFEAQRGFFSHDQDPESWEFRATTLPGLGLLERTYTTDKDTFAEEDLTREDGTSTTQWNSFLHYIQHLNQEDPANKRYKLFYIVRHGQGLHNVKETEVGREEWNVSCQ